MHAIRTGGKRAKLSFDIECYRLRKYIGAYSAVLGRVDAIAFTAGVGENSFLHRVKVCEGLESMGVSIDYRKNKRAIGGANDMEIHSIGSLVKKFCNPDK